MILGEDPKHSLLNCIESVSGRSGSLSLLSLSLSLSLSLRLSLLGLGLGLGLSLGLSLRPQGLPEESKGNQKTPKGTTGAKRVPKL